MGSVVVAGVAAGAGGCAGWAAAAGGVGWAGGEAFSTWAQLRTLEQMAATSGDWWT